VNVGTRCICVATLLFAQWFSLCDEVGSQEIERTPEVVYIGSVFDGTQYISILSPAAFDTLYLLADAEHAITLKQTLVYFWETTGEYKADWEGQNQLLKGRLEIRRRDDLVYTADLVEKVLVRQRGERLIQEILFGEEAIARYQAFTEDIRRYRTEYERYSQAEQQYRTELWDRYEHPEQYRDADPLVEPSPPDPVGEYVTEPVLAYRVHLPPAQYRMQVVDEEGNTIPGSEKALKVFSYRREGLSYVVYTDHRWTDQGVSREAEDVIYVGEADALFLQPFRQVEFYADDYVNLREPQRMHDKLDYWVWIDVRPVWEGNLRLWRNGVEMERVEYRPFLVEQVPGKTLGYRIIDIPEGEASVSTSFYAFKVDLTDQVPDTIRLSDAGGEIAGSARSIRPIAPRNPLLMVSPAIIVLLTGGLLVCVRRRSTRG
jgi:hypothetical protein